MFQVISNVPDGKLAEPWRQRFTDRLPVTFASAGNGDDTERSG
jgi:hypothetical protein